MSERARKLLDEALALPDEERVTMVAELLASLPSDPGDDLSPELAAEIEQRARNALSSSEPGLPWQSVRDELLGDLRKPR